MAKTSFYTGSGTDSNAVNTLESLKDQAQTSATNAASSATAAASSASTAASNATAAASSATSAAASVASLNTDVATQSANGLMSSADKTKLDGVESGATADQTAAEIKTAYESNSDTNAFTDAEQTKLSGIEASADVTDATNVQAAGALMDSEVTSLSGIKTLTVPDSTTVSTFGASLVDDADAAAARTTLGLGTASTTASTAYATAAQGTTADAALPKAGGTMTGAITFASGQTFDGRDVSADGSKLDGIESGATADQTAAEIKTAYESNSDTNAFTDALQTKLNGIETSADVTDATNVQAAGALMDSELTSEASVKAINQGLATTDSPTFAGLTANGDIVFEGATADDYETTVTAADPTADRTITLPDNTGTVVIRDGDNSVGNSIKVLGEPNGGSLYDGVLTLQGTGEGFLVGAPGSGQSLIASSRTGATSGNLQIYGTNTSDKVSFKRGIVSIDTNSGFEFTDGTNDLTVDHSTLYADRTITLPDQTGTAMLWQSPWPDDPSTGSGNNYAIGDNTLPSVTSGYNNIAIGTNALSGVTTNYRCVAVGHDALSSITTAAGSTAVGTQALDNVTTGGSNTAVGYIAGRDLTTGTFNVAVGNAAMRDNTTDSNTTAVGYWCGGGNFLTGGTYLGASAGNYNYSSKDYQTAIGYGAQNDCFGDFNTAVGAFSMTDGNHYQSTAVGYLSLSASTTNSAIYNVAVGYAALNGIYTGDHVTALGYDVDIISNTNYDSVIIGSQARAADQCVSIGRQAMGSAQYVSDGTVAIGYQAGYDLDNGTYCTFVGYQAGYAGGTGSYNVGSGAFTLDGLTSGQYNVAFGSSALGQCNTADKNTGVGHNAGYGITSGSNNTFLGMNAGWAQDSVSTGALTTGSNVTCLGYEAMPSSATATNEITLGDNDITSLRCNVQTISSLSDERDKTAIADIPYGLDFINDMRPVQFTWNRRDGSLGAKPDIGFIAQELHDVELDHSSSSRTRLVSWENPEKLEADYVRSYPILVKAVQELSAKCDALEARLAALEGA